MKNASKVGKVLLAGETWVSRSIHIKGFDEFSSTTFHNGALAFLSVMHKYGIDVVQMPAHQVPDSFPRSLEELNDYSAIILSDIGSNSLLLSNELWLKSRSIPNAIDILSKWVTAGGSLLMVGGYLSFQGFQGIANFSNTSLNTVLPVLISQFDDRVEVPQGFEFKIEKEHIITQNFFKTFNKLEQRIPKLLGYNRTSLKAKSDLLLSINNDPLLAVCEIGNGRTAVWTSDIGPHWCPPEFITWTGYEELLSNLVSWLIRKI
ncbi:MAG: glutamine amidotransferase [Actinomycetota bacterium]|nr:glutamine amidotransferase [Actinomycetota bacterium]